MDALVKPGFVAPKQWTFETKEIAEAFDPHVREQLPWYDLATYGTKVLGSHYLPRGGTAYDIGAGNGNMARAFAEEIEARDIDFISIESSLEMAKSFRGPGRVMQMDACDASFTNADLVISFLAMIFIPPARRGALIRRIIDRLQPGGAFILVERMLPEHGYPSLAQARLTLASKQRQGADPADIFAKEMSLIGHQRPLAEGALLGIGFEQWFRMGNFAGYIYEQPESYLPVG